jgi:hypothetical protein
MVLPSNAARALSAWCCCSVTSMVKRLMITVSCLNDRAISLPQMWVCAKPARSWDSPIGVRA